ncbi:MAG TPA: hypothetical protein VMU56_01640 [Beijerinckiaceae bacterium]|nr:hypothetical protein [Beijerinckiaceae bacterium]
MQDKPVRLDRQDARQGKSGLNVRWVLSGGLILVVIAFALVWLFG